MQQNISGETLTTQVGKGGAIFLLGRSLGYFIKFIIHVVLGRFLGAGLYGLYALAYSVIIDTGRFISTLGLENGLVKFIPIYKLKKKELMKGTILSALAIGFLFSVFMAILLYFMADMLATGFFKKPGMAMPIKFLAFVLPFYTLMLLICSVFRGFKKMKRDVAIKSVFLPLLNLVAVLVSFLIGLRLLGAVYAFTISALITCMVALYLLYKTYPEIISKMKPEYDVWKLLRFSLPAFLIGITILMLVETDKIMLGYFRTSVDVGIYTAASKVAIQILLILTSINFAFEPHISQLFHKKKIRDLDRLFKFTTKLVFALTLPLFFFLIIYAKEIMWMFGKEFIVGSSVLVVLSFCQAFDSFTGSTQRLLLMCEKHDLSLINNICAVAVNIFLNLALIPKYGIIGAAIATGITIILLNLTMLIEVKLLLNMIPYNKSFIKPVLSGILALLFLVIIRMIPNIIIQLALVAAIYFPGYFGMIYLFGLEYDERLLLKSFLIKFKIIKKHN